MKYLIIINSVLTLQVSTASLPHDREPCEIKVVSNHTCSLISAFAPGARTPKWLSTAGNQFNSWGFPQVPYSGPGLCRTYTFFHPSSLSEACILVSSSLLRSAREASMGCQSENRTRACHTASRPTTIEQRHIPIEPQRSLIEPHRTLIEPHCTLIEPRCT
jgi:hypothetical protein